MIVVDARMICGLALMLKRAPTELIAGVAGKSAPARLATSSNAQTFATTSALRRPGDAVTISQSRSFGRVQRQADPRR